MTRAGTIARTQMWLSLTLLSAISVTCLLVGLLASFSPVMDNHIASELARHRAINGVYPYTGGYRDSPDYLLLDQLGASDFSRGGAYFIGASDTMISIMPWELPPVERKLIHNYAMGDLSHREARHFLRCLVEDHNLLQGGGQRTTVFLGLFYGMTRKKPNPNHDVVGLQFQRYGLYTFDIDEGIHRTSMSSLGRFLRVQRVYANRFLHILTLPTTDVRARKEVGSAEHRAQWIRIMGEDWQEEMRRQLHDLELLIDYLQERNVHVRVLLPPQATWHSGLPFADAYVEMLKPILVKRGVPTIDLRRLLPDEDYGDATHYNYTGQWKVHRAYREVALQALAEMGTKLEH